MKRAMNFRLSNHAISILSVLKQRLEISQANVIERALDFYVKKEAVPRNSLMNYAGALNDKEASSMLSHIKLRKNKNLKIKL